MTDSPVAAAPYPPFSGDDTVCPKCGAGRVGRRYQPKGNRFLAPGAITRFEQDAPEWMLRECRECDYQWPEMCADLRKAEAAAGTLSNVAVSEIQPGQEWLLEGAWVRVVEVEVNHPDDRVTIVYEQDGELETTREYRGFEQAAVR